MRSLYRMLVVSAWVLVAFSSSPVSADPIPLYWTTVAVGASDIASSSQEMTGAPSSLSYGHGVYLFGTDLLLVFSGFAQAGRGVLHASSSFDVTGSGSIPTDTSTTTEAVYTEDGVHAITVGPPDLLTEIVAYEVTFDLDGSVSGPADSFAELSAADCPTTWPSSGSCFISSSIYDHTTPLGPVTFFITPPGGDASAAFNAVFELNTLGSSDNGGSYGSADFTATLASFMAVDADDNPIPGVEVEYADGSIWGPNGFVPAGSTPAITPEPSTLTLLGTGLLGAATLWRRIRS
jgi:hypothetical protein